MTIAQTATPPSADNTAARALGNSVRVLAGVYLALPWLLYVVSPAAFRFMTGGLTEPKILTMTFAAPLMLLQQVSAAAAIFMLSRSAREHPLDSLRLRISPSGFGSQVTTASLIASIMLLVHIALREGFAWLGISGATALSATQARPAALLIVITLIVGAPLVEELIMRGYLLPPLMRSRIGFAGAAIITTSLWTVLHAYAPWHAIVTTFIFGLLLAYALRRTGSVWTCIMAHAMFNTVPASSEILFR